VAIGVGQSIERHYGTSRSWGGLSEIFFPWLVKITGVDGFCNGKHFTHVHHRAGRVAVGSL
jgi:hypothetical protein